MTLTDHPPPSRAGRSTRLGTIDFLRGSAILAVIWFHAVGQVEYGDPYGRPAELPVVDVVSAALDPLRMPLLIFLSGFLLPRSLLKDARSYLLGKTRAIAWPYVLWSVFNLGFLWAMSPFRDDDVTLNDFARIFYNPSTVQWFLGYLFVYYVIALALPARWRLHLIVPLLIGSEFVTHGGLQSFVYLLAFFFLGERFSEHVASQRKPPRALVAAAWAALALALFAGVTGFVDLKFQGWYSPVVALALVALWELAARCAGRRWSRPVELVGQQSIVYYVNHYLVITVTFHALTRSGVVLPPILLFVGCCTVTLATSALLVWMRRFPAGDALFELPRFNRSRPAPAEEARLHEDEEPRLALPGQSAHSG